MSRARSPRNQTLSLLQEDRARLLPLLRKVKGAVASLEELRDTVFHGDLFSLLPLLPQLEGGFIDLLIADPPYNLDKSFNGKRFSALEPGLYAEWLASWLLPLKPLLKSTASLYICGDWHSSGSIFPVLHEHFLIRNRITWEREKGRSAKTNWKNCSEDIWFATVSERYDYYPEAVKMKRRVIAPYRQSGEPRGWSSEAEGNFRLTGASNFWSDLTVPFWSMPENTDHPTQKPEKLIAKLLLASTQPGALVFDPFLGSGTTAAVCRKLGRHFFGVEQDREYCLLTLRRLELAAENATIQGYREGVFWERNSAPPPEVRGKKGGDRAISERSDCDSP